MNRMFRRSVMMDRRVFVQFHPMLRNLIAGFVLGIAFGSLATAQSPASKPANAKGEDPKTPGAQPEAAKSEDKQNPAAPENAEKAQPLSTAEHIAKAIELLDGLDNPTESQDPKAIFDEINQHVIAVQTAEPTNPWLFYLLGRSYAARGRSADAIEQLRKFVETREGRNEWKAYCLLGDQSLAELPNLAKPNYDKAAALKNGEPKILLGQSRCAQKLGNLENALTLAKAAVDADGHKKSIYVANLAKMHLAKKQWADAEIAALEAFKIAEADARLHPRLRPVLETLDSQAQLLIDILQPRMGESGWSADDAIRLAGYIRHRADTSRRLSLYDAFQVLERAIKQSPDAPQKLLDEYNNATHELDAAASPS